MIVAATGHRPKYLKDFTPDPHDDHTTDILVHEAAMELVNHDIKQVLSGGAEGWDYAVARAAQELAIPLTLIIPYKGFSERFTEIWRERYMTIVENGATVEYVTHNKHTRAFFQRNEVLVKRADLMLALLDPSSKKGGTLHCVNSAKTHNVEVVNLWQKVTRQLTNGDPYIPIELPLYEEWICPICSVSYGADRPIASVPRMFGYVCQTCNVPLVMA